MKNRPLYLLLNAVLSGLYSVIFWGLCTLSEGYWMVIPRPVTMIVTLAIAVYFAYRAHDNLNWDIDFIIGSDWEKFVVGVKFMGTVLLNQIAYLLMLLLLGLVGIFFL